MTTAHAPTPVIASASRIPHHPDVFETRHIGPDHAEIARMLGVLGRSSLDELIDAVVPEQIRTGKPLDIPLGLSEREALEKLRSYASRNEVVRSCIGMGYSGTVTPTVILRNVLENPGWYTQYTPYQAEISQGRLEALLNFQTMVADLTGLPLAGASLLDESTAAAEAMAMCYSIAGQKRRRFLIAEDCHPQTIAVCRTRAAGMGVGVDVLAADDFVFTEDVCGVLVQYPSTDGVLRDYGPLADRAHKAGALVACATDLLALTLVKPPGEWGADIAVGSAQRFGVPLGFGGPHAGFLSTHERHARRMPGRIIGVTKDAHGNTALRMAIQTREQHIKRDRATSNICTAQALLAVISGFYGVYHGPAGLKQIASRVHALTMTLAEGLRRLGHTVPDEPVFDTLRVTLVGQSADECVASARRCGFNLRKLDGVTVGISLDETTTPEDVEVLLSACNKGVETGFGSGELVPGVAPEYEPWLARTSAFMSNPVFNTHHSETEMLRYIKSLESRDLSLCHSMIPLGSCTMKLNATSEMLPVTWGEFGDLHPYAPREQWEGYHLMMSELDAWLCDITGFHAVSLQPNAGSQGEYAGLLAIRAYHASRGESRRDVCLIPVSAHGTNPASAVIAGLRVVPIQCDDRGDIDLADLRAKAEVHKEELAAIMVTYPSTHGVFESHIKEVCGVVHEHGGQVYMDGANMNAQVGLCRPGEMGADVVHLNLHKTFCIPHGGGGPGMGPIGVAEHLAPFLPASPLSSEDKPVGPIAGAPFGSASILTISWMYIAMMGAAGLTQATKVAILNANYMAKRLEGHYRVLFTADNGTVAHEFIIDLRPFEKLGIRPDDVAKRLMDYGFHAPTMSWPVAGTLMIEPTESESMGELDRYCDALIAIREEIGEIERGERSAEDSPLKHAPFTVERVSSDDWPHTFSREQAAYPAPWLRDRLGSSGKFWPPVGRVDNAYGDRNLHCTCPSVEDLV